ncbi:hypothetical protein A4R89_12185 [Acetobacter ascendens]|nr:hypothetical protein A4R89_12185 [Acetobacter ascendens]
MIRTGTIITPAQTTGVLRLAGTVPLLRLSRVLTPISTPPPTMVAAQYAMTSKFVRICIIIATIIVGIMMVSSLYKNLSALMTSPSSEAAMEQNAGQ